MQFFGRYQIDVRQEPGIDRPYRWHLFEIGAATPFLTSKTTFRVEAAAYRDARNVISRHASRKREPFCSQGKKGG